MGTTLALDLGTKTGFASYSLHGGYTSGVKDFSTKRNEGGGMRYLRFRKWLDSIKDGITEIYFEEVRRHAGTQAAHVYGGLMGTLTMWCEENNVPYSSVPVGTIKKSACGNGRASKLDMVDKAIQIGFNPIDDNEADAIHLLKYVIGERKVGR